VAPLSRVKSSLGLGLEKRLVGYFRTSIPTLNLAWNTLMELVVMAGRFIVGVNVASTLGGMGDESALHMRLCPRGVGGELATSELAARL